MKKRFKRAKIITKFSYFLFYFLLVFLICFPLNAQNDKGGLKMSRDGENFTINYSFKPLEKLLTSIKNSVREFIPIISSDDARKINRNIPLVIITTPWDGKIRKELPEYVHLYKNGKEYILSGRENSGLKKMEEPKWIEKGGTLSLDLPFESNITLHFRVIPHHSWVETKWGITNNSEIPLTNVWFQCCSGLRGVPGFEDKSPATSCVVVDGYLRNWLEIPHFGNIPSESSDWNTNLWLTLFLKDISYGNNQERLRYIADSQTHESRRVAKVLGDLPFVMKTSLSDTTRHILLFSSPSRDVFYNPLTPCMHSDPYLGEVLPGKTKWASEYTCYYQGDITYIKKSLNIK